MQFTPYSLFYKHKNEAWSKEFFTPLSSLSNLESLVLPSVLITDAIIPYIVKLKALKTLNIGSCSISDNGLQLLANLQDLQTLGISYCYPNCDRSYYPGPDFQFQFPSEDGWVNLLKRLPKLEHLNVSSRQKNDKLIDCLEKTTNLKSFNIGDVDFSILFERLKDPEEIPKP